MWPDASTGTQFAYGNGSGYALVSFFGKLNYNFSDKYLASFTLRRDGSSRFGSNNRYAMFPAATLGWRISNESFMSKTNPWLSDLKLRASWGKTGNQAISNTARYGLYTSDYGQDRGTGTAYDIYLQNSGTFPSGYRQIQATNNNLKWETAIQYDLGLDFGLFNGTIYGTYDAYIKDIKDMLISPSYLGSKGEGGASWANGPSMRNWGMELSLGYRKTLLDGLGVDVLGSVDFFRNKVTYLPATTTGSYAHTTKQNLVQSKQPYGSSVGYVVEGLFQTMDEVYASGQSNARLGGLKYADLDGDGVIDADDQTWIYNPVPDFSYGLNIALNYKGFDLSMFWQGVYGVDVWNNQKYQTDFWSIDDPGSNKGTRLLNAWTATNPNSTIPALTTNNIANENRSSTYYVENGSYLKLRTLQIGYNLPKSVVKKASMQNARIYLSGSNLLTIKSKSLTCSDPENPSWNYPLSSSISCGVQIGF
jgi:TonB-linked SusC/RagA family outer membrane protein